MFFAVIITIFLTAAVYFILRRFFKDSFDSSFEILAVSVPLSFAVFAALTSVFLLFLPTIVSGFLAFAAIFGFGAFSFFKIKKERRGFWTADKSELKNKIFYYGLTVILSVFLIILVLNSFKVLPDGSWSFDKGATVDAPYHLAQVIRIGFTGQWDFEEPNFSGEFIRYPYFINLVSGFLLKLGAPLGFAFHFPAVLLIFSMMFLLVLFFRFFGFGKVLIAICVLGVLFGGGWGYVAYFQNHGLASLPIRDNVPFPMQNISYPAMIPGFLVVQRPFLLGFPLFLFALFCFLRGLKNKSLHSFFLAGIIAGLLPFSHSHSFIALCAVIGAVIVYLFLSRDDMFFDAVRGFVFPVSFLAIPQLAALLLLPEYLADGAMKLRLGWMSGLNEVGGLNLPASDYPKFFPWLRFIWTNFGFLVFLPFMAVTYFKKLKTNQIFLAVTIGALFLWILPNIAQFQTWDFDTNKFFAYAILLSLAGAGIIIHFLSPKIKKSGIAVLAAIVLFSLPSAFIASKEILFRGSENRLVMLNSNERDVADWLKKNTGDDVVILSSAAIFDPRTIQNPVVVASARKTSVGFMTWLYTHGIAFEKRYHDAEAFFKNPADKKILKAADYLLIDDFLREKYPQLENQLVSAGCKIVYKTGLLAVAKLKYK